MASDKDVTSFWPFACGALGGGFRAGSGAASSIRVSGKAPPLLGGGSGIANSGRTIVQAAPLHKELIRRPREANGESWPLIMIPLLVNSLFVFILLIHFFDTRHFGLDGLWCQSGNVDSLQNPEKAGLHFAPSQKDSTKRNKR